MENSYDSPDRINEIDWGLKEKNKYVFNYVRALIKMRKDHPAFRMQSSKQIASGIRFLEGMTEGIIAYTIDGHASGDKWKKILIIFNGSAQEKSIMAQPGNYNVFVAGNMLSDVIGGKEGFWRLEPYSCTILYEK